MFAVLLIRTLLFKICCLVFFICGVQVAWANGFEQYSRASLAFAAANLNDPESVFGHVFVVFHHAEIPEPDDPVVEFYGNLRDVDFALVKTVLSTVPGQYKISSYSEKLRLYDQEGRDVYLRPLRQEVSIPDLKARVEDSLGRSFEYDFLNINCAFYIELLLSQSQASLGDSWSIRQPLDVYLNYGDKSGEIVIRSADRLKAEFESVPNSQLNKLDGIEYFTAYKELVDSAVASNLNNAAMRVMNHPEPDSGIPPPAVVEQRGNLRVLMFSRGVDISYLAFVSENAWLSDPLPKPSRLEVSNVRARCVNNQDISCSLGVEFFNNRTLPADGPGQAKILTAGLRLDGGPQANIQIGLGAGLGRILDLPLWFGLVPLAQVDTVEGATVGLTSTLQWITPFYRAHLQLDSNPGHNPIDSTKKRFSITHQPSGVSMQWSDADRFGLAYRLIF